MLHCEDYKVLISALLDEEITEAERGDLMDHLEQCADCAAFLSDQLAMREALRGLTAEAPAGFADSVMARVRETAQERPETEKKVLAFPQIRRWAGLAACCAVVALGVLTLGGLPRTMNDTANCAVGAPEMLDNGAAAPEAYMNGFAVGADAAAPEYGMADAARSEVPESSAAGGVIVEENSDCKVLFVDEYAALLTCGSDIAARFVTDTLGQEWISGAYYPLTADEYTQLLDLLTDAGEPFTEETGTDETELYLLLAE